MNQFVDAGMLLTTIDHQVGFLMAEKSFSKPVIGDFARAIGCIPVARPQDNAKRGPGTILLEGLTVTGKDTKFTEIKKGDKIRLGKSPDGYRLKEVISDTEGVVAEEMGEPSPALNTLCQGVYSTYDVMSAVDQAKMFDSVQSALALGKCLGIFPEGGSHDQTDLLPLKAGVAAIALGVLDKYDVSVPIVPIGLNYFHLGRFRGRVVIEIGEPVTITGELVRKYRESRRSGYQALLGAVEEGMRSVIVTAPDYAELKLLHTVRRLLQRSGEDSTKRKQDMSRRLSTAFTLLKESPNGVPQELVELKDRLLRYQEQLSEWGLKDYQVLHMQLTDADNFPLLLYTFLHGLVILLLASVPSLLLNAPVGFLAKWFADEEAKKDLQASRVKVAARDVLLSKKIVFSILAVPSLWLVYALLLLSFSPFQRKTILLLFLSCPFFSYLGVMAVQQSVIDYKHLRPAFLRLFPAFRAQAKALPVLRAELRKQVRDAVRKFGPALGSLYSDKSADWEKGYRRGRALSGGEEDPKRD